MSTTPTIVLKFGGSVLRDERDLSALVHEVYRHYRRGARVLVIVSAFGGTTDRLQRDADRVGDRRAAHAFAALLGTGEATAAALAVLALERAGVPASVLESHAIGLVATGDALDATPARVDTQAIERAFRRSGVLVSPGFVARDTEGAPVLMGRGGSDLTALFLAQRIGARTCRLVKDVEGLYDRDPALPGPSPARYVTLHWDDARALGGAILQEKALAFAREQELPFEVGGLGAATTHVGDECSIRTPAERQTRPLRVALLGLGNVGTGVYRELAARPERFAVACVLVRDTRKERSARGVESLLTTDFADVLAARPDVVVELLGGTSPAREWIAAAREAGCDVVSAGKAVMAEYGATSIPDVVHSASVGGALPALERASRLGRLNLAGFEGVLNGTTNYVLDRLATGTTLAAAVREAQEAGFAEADPTLDLDGTDVAHKIVLLARAAWPGSEIRWLEHQGISELGPEYVRATNRAGRRVRLVGACHRVGAGRHGAAGLVASVAPRVLPLSDPLARTTDEGNALRFALGDGSEEVLAGKGAGRWPTTTSVMADLFDLARAYERRHVRGLAETALSADAEREERHAAS